MACKSKFKHLDKARSEEKAGVKYVCTAADGPRLRAIAMSLAQAAQEQEADHAPTCPGEPASTGSMDDVERARQDHVDSVDVGFLAGNSTCSPHTSAGLVGHGGVEWDCASRPGVGFDVVHWTWLRRLRDGTAVTRVAAPISGLRSTVAAEVPVCGVGQEQVLSSPATLSMDPGRGEFHSTSSDRSVGEHALDDAGGRFPMGTDLDLHPTMLYPDVAREWQGGPHADNSPERCSGRTADPGGWAGHQQISSSSRAVDVVLTDVEGARAPCTPSHQQAC